MQAQRKSKPAAKAKERVEPHFGKSRAPARKSRKPRARKSARRLIRRVALRIVLTACIFVVVMLGGALAGVLGAVFAIPVAAAILAISDYLHQRDDALGMSDEAAPAAAVIVDQAGAPAGK